MKNQKPKVNQAWNPSTMVELVRWDVERECVRSREKVERWMECWWKWDGKLGSYFVGFEWGIYRVGGKWVE